MDAIFFFLSGTTISWFLLRDDDDEDFRGPGADPIGKELDRFNGRRRPPVLGGVVDANKKLGVAFILSSMRMKGIFLVSEDPSWFVVLFSPLSAAAAADKDDTLSAAR